MKIYLSCPIANNDRHKEELEAMEAFVQKEYPDAEVISPLDIPACEDRSCVPEGTEYEHSWSCYLKYDIAVMVLCDLVVVREGWAISKGVSIETRIAWDLGMPIHTIHLAKSKKDYARIYRRDHRSASIRDGK